MPNQMPAYANYLMPQSGNSVIDPQLGNDYLSNLENTLNQQEGQQFKQLLAQNNMLGTASSGNTNFGLGQIAGNTQNQFGQAYTGLANRATGQAEQQQFGTQYEQQAFQNALQAQAQQAKYQQQLLQLQSQLAPGYSSPSFGQVLGQTFAGNLPGMILGNNGQPGLAQNSFSNFQGWMHQTPQPTAIGITGGGGMNIDPYNSYYNSPFATAFSGANPGIYGPTGLPQVTDLAALGG